MEEASSRGRIRSILNRIGGLAPLLIIPPVRIPSDRDGLGQESFQGAAAQESRTVSQSAHPRIALMVVANAFVTATRVRREARSIARRGYELHILCWDRQARHPSQEKMGQCQIRNIRLGKTSGLPFSRLYYAMAAILFQVVTFIWILRQVATFRAVILHAHDFNVLPGCAAAKLFLRNRIRLLYDCHELTPGLYQEWFGSFVSSVVGSVERAGVSHADAIVSANEAVHSHLKQQNSVRAEIIYNCPSIAEIPKIQPEDAKAKLGLSGLFVVLFSGWVRQDYDFDMILEAAVQLERSHVQGVIFVFIGPSETMVSLIDAVTKAGVRSYFDFRGWVPESELFVYYLASDLCYAVTRDLGPSTKILTPIKMFESMACGVPVIVRDRTLAAEIVRHWGCGIVINTVSSSFAGELICLKQNKEELLTLGAAGLNAFHHVYSWDLMEARLVQLYAELENDCLLTLQPKDSQLNTGQSSNEVL